MPRTAAATVSEEADDHLRGGRIVGWYRIDPMARLLRALALGGAVMTLGSVVMALSFARFGHAPVDFRDQGALWLAFLIGALGLATIVGGGLLAFSGLRRVLEEERYLALRSDGAYFRDGATRSMLPWSEVETVRREGASVVFVRHDGTTWVRAERFAGADAETLARRCAEVRRKALFGLL